MKRLIFLCLLLLTSFADSLGQKIDHVILIGADGLDEYGMFPSIYTLLRRDQPRAEIGVIHEWDGIGYLFPKAAVSYIKEKKPPFLFIHLHDVDSVGQQVGHVRRSIIRLLNVPIRTWAIFHGLSATLVLKRVQPYCSLSTTGVSEGARLHVNGRNGSALDSARAGRKKGYEVKQSIMTFDTAATLARLFKLTPPHVWIGRPVNEAFK